MNGGCLLYASVSRHQAREAEPKDYDMNKHPIRSLAFSTYKRIGNVTDGSNIFSLLHLLSGTKIKEMIATELHYVDNDTLLAHIQQELHLAVHESAEAAASLSLSIYRKKKDQSSVVPNLNTGEPKGVFGSALPSHGPEHNKYYLDTTYNSDYVPPYPFTGCEEDTKMKQEEMEDKSSAFKKMKSQFTDTADYRRNGWNTWQDESGVYANSHFKAQVFAKTETIPERPV
uniref:Uncharacterized protein n=1 Tax=Biomphalaria glabrata TaxID=6526 RepID=A0A2C9M6C4_BIOGL